MADDNTPRTPEEERAARALLHAAKAQAESNRGERTFIEAGNLAEALHAVAYDKRWERHYRVHDVLHKGGSGAEILREFADSLKHALDEIRAGREPQLPDDPGPVSATVHARRRGVDRPGFESPEFGSDSAIESADEALQRASEPEIVNEILAGGAVAASVTAAASIAKAKIEATTQREKNHLEAETERLRIQSQERIAGFQGARDQFEPEVTEPD